MSKSSALVLSILPLLALACPTETNIRPAGHEAPHRSPAKDEANQNKGPGMAGLVKEATADVKAANKDQAEAEEKARAQKAPAAVAKPAEPAKPVPGDIPAPADVAAPPASAKKTASGLAYQVLTKGTGTAKPRDFDKVEVNYTGWTTDGKMFDSSVKRGRPASFAVNRVIPGWTEGLQLMVVGEKTRLWIPSELAYGDKPGRPNGMLVFDVELLGITEGVPPPPVPTDVAAPPADATTTASGLAYKVLTKGTGAKKPTGESKVTVHYSGWTTDGKMFDSSVSRGKPATFGLNRVIPGWTEGVALMVEGEKTRLWIPEKLAYEGKPGKPAGMLVFDVELVSIDE